MSDSHKLSVRTDTTQDSQAADQGSRPTFILFAARTGSTLLRLLLDTHPEIASPPESHVAQVCESLDRAWRAVSLAGAAAPLTEDHLGDMAARASEPIAWYAQSYGKPQWCDKSLENLRLSPLLAKVFPEARFIVLVRHCLDFLVSALDASRWGFYAYGLETYIRQTPNNIVHALVTYWCDYTEGLLHAHDHLGKDTILVRYEDVVQSPDMTMTRICNFLAIESIPDIATRAFEVPHDIGPGDHKATFTSSVDPSSVGTGRQVPVSLIDDDLLDRMNKSLQAAGYAPVDREWNNSLSTPNIECADPAEAARAVWGGDGMLGTSCSQIESETTTYASVILEDRGVQWKLDLRTNALHTCTEGKCESSGYLITDTSTLRDVVHGRVNIGAALRAGTVRARGGTAFVGVTVEALQTLPFTNDYVRH